MKRKMITITLMALLVLLLSVGGVSGQEPEPEGEIQLEEEISAAAKVGSLISYQGRLTEGGSPVSGLRNMAFRLYSNSSCSSQVWDVVRNDVLVEDGLFSVKLYVNQAHFNGQGLWLGVDVGNAGTNIVCEEIVPAPYALSLRPGAEIADTNTEVEFNLYTYTYIPPIPLESKYGIRSQVTGGSYNYGYGVYGYSAAGNLGSYGVYGRSDSTSGQGVRGYASATSGTTYGVSGRSDSASGAGVYGFSSSGTGVHAISDSDTAVWAETSGGFAAVDGRNTADYSASAIYGVRGKATLSSWPGDFPPPIYGVYGEAVSLSGSRGVYGKGDTGVYGYGTGSYGGFFVGYRGIYGEATGDGPAAVLVGNVEIQNSSYDTIIELGEGLDYAEGFDVSDETEIAPGTVLVIDPGHPGELTTSDTPYDHKVAGIVAGAQGMGSAVRLAPGQFDYDVALAGRVYCSVDATETGVEPGDLLTTSATPGYAMKATDYARAQGAILGKAMERLEKGETGQILVLVTLQ